MSENQVFFGVLALILCLSLFEIVRRLGQIKSEITGMRAELQWAFGCGVEQFPVLSQIRDEIQGLSTQLRLEPMLRQDENDDEIAQPKTGSSTG